MPDQNLKISVKLWWIRPEFKGGGGGGVPFQRYIQSCGWNGVYFKFQVSKYMNGYYFHFKKYINGVSFSPKKNMNGYNHHHHHHHHHHHRYGKYMNGYVFVTSPRVYESAGVRRLQPHVRTQNHGKLPPMPEWISDCIMPNSLAICITKASIKDTKLQYSEKPPLSVAFLRRAWGYGGPYSIETTNQKTARFGDS